MSDCIFCKIVDGELPAKVVYQDEDVAAFLDVNPLVEGHTLVVPVRHAAGLVDLSEQEAADYFAKVPRINRAVQQAVKADGATLAWNDGRAAGQEVDHTHLHIVPRFDGDAHGPIHALFGGHAEVGEERQEELVATIGRILGG